MKMSKKQVAMAAVLAGMLFGAAGQTWAETPAIGSGSGTESVVAGLDNTAAGNKASALGTSNEATGNYSTAVGRSNHALGVSSTAVGASNDIGTYGDGKRSTAVGYANTVYATQASAVGARNYVHGEQSSAMGYFNAVYGPNSGAFGSQNTVGEVDDTANPVSGTGENTYVVGAGNTVTANNAMVLGNEVTTVADNSVVLGVGSSSEEENTVSVGTTGSERRIVHVADGTDAHDAATYGQLKQEISDRMNANAALNSRIDEVEKDATKGIAKASALAALHPLDYDPENKFDVAAAGGFYKGENAFALGAFYRPSRNVMFSLATTVSGGDNAYNVGATFKVGKSGKPKEAGVSTAELYTLISAMQDKLDQQQKRIEELEAAQGK